MLIVSLTPKITHVINIMLNSRIFRNVISDYKIDSQNLYIPKKRVPENKVEQLCRDKILKLAG